MVSSRSMTISCGLPRPMRTSFAIWLNRLRLHTADRLIATIRALVQTVITASFMQQRLLETQLCFFLHIPFGKSTHFMDDNKQNQPIEYVEAEYLDATPIDGTGTPVGQDPPFQPHVYTYYHRSDNCIPC